MAILWIWLVYCLFSAYKGHIVYPLEGMRVAETFQWSYYFKVNIGSATVPQFFDSKLDLEPHRTHLSPLAISRRYQSQCFIKRTSTYRRNHINTSNPFPLQWSSTSEIPPDNFQLPERWNPKFSLICLVYQFTDTRHLRSTDLIYASKFGSVIYGHAQLIPSVRRVSSSGRYDPRSERGHHHSQYASSNNCGIIISLHTTIYSWSNLENSLNIGDRFFKNRFRVSQSKWPDTFYCFHQYFKRGFLISRSQV